MRYYLLLAMLMFFGATAWRVWSSDTRHYHEAAATTQADRLLAFSGYARDFRSLGGVFEEGVTPGSAVPKPAWFGSASDIRVATVAGKSFIYLTAEGGGDGGKILAAMADRTKKWRTFNAGRKVAGQFTAVRANAAPVASLPDAIPEGAVVLPMPEEGVALGGENGSSPAATALSNGVALNLLSGDPGGETLYSFAAEAGAPLNIMTYGGTGDVSVYVKKGAEPTTTDYDFASVRSGTSETVRISVPEKATYFIKLVGARAYGGLTLVARQ